MWKKRIRNIAVFTGLLMVWLVVALQSNKWITVHHSKSEAATTATRGAVVIEENDIDCVKLSDIEPPVWNEPFVALECDNTYYEVNWGVGEDKAFLAEQSGYPGFGTSMLVIGDIKKPLEAYKLITNYGEYEYKFVGSRKAVLNDSHSNLVDYERGKEIINFSNMNEMLYVFNPVEKMVYVAQYLKGTKIVN